MNEPTESFLRKVEEIAETSYRLRALLNLHGGYEYLPKKLQGHVQEAVLIFESKENSR